MEALSLFALPALVYSLPANIVWGAFCLDIGTSTLVASVYYSRVGFICRFVVASVLASICGMAQHYISFWMGMCMDILYLTWWISGGVLLKNTACACIAFVLSYSACAGEYESGLVAVYICIYIHIHIYIYSI